MITQNSESASFTEIDKILIDPVGFGRNKTNLMFSELKALVAQKKSKLSFFSIGQKMITQNLECSLPSIIPRVIKISSNSFYV